MTCLPAGARCLVPEVKLELSESCGQLLAPLLGGDGQVAGRQHSEHDPQQFDMQSARARYEFSRERVERNRGQENPGFWGRCSLALRFSAGCLSVVPV